jgi:predicted nucleotidyltransferase
MIQWNKAQLEIVGLFRKNIFLRASIRRIMILLKKKSYARIYEAVAGLEKANILRIERFGHARVAELLLGNESLALLTYIEETESIGKKLPGIELLLGAKELADDILIVTGSYAKGTEKKGSDVDVAVITSGDSFKKQNLLENLTLSSNPPIHPVVFSEKNFKEMLLEKDENFGKETFKNRLILKNARKYYVLIKEAKENGFRS